MKNRIAVMSTAVIALFAGLVTSPSWALTTVEVAKLLASDGVSGDKFGFSTAIDGDTLIVGSERGESAYMFTRSGNTWTQQAKLISSDWVAGDLFGFEVSTDGNTVVVSAVWENDRAGSGYVFTRSGNTWTQQAKLVASDAAPGDGLGNRVSISGDTIVMGAPGRADNGPSSGAAYVFTRSRDSWTQQAKLLAPDGATDDRFGGAVSIENDTIIVGAHEDDDGGSNTGSAYVFIRSGNSWTQQAKLLASDAASGQFFGISVANDGDGAAIGNAGRGKAYVFTRSGDVWSEQAKLVPADGSSGIEFPRRIAMAGNTVVVGATRDLNDSGVRTGSAYLFTRSGNTWTQQAKLLASDGESGDELGFGVSTDGSTISVGARLDDDNGFASGSAYVFSLTDVVSIDIKPGNNRNPVNPRSKGKLKVAILTTEEFDASTVDAHTVLFGPGSAEPVRYRFGDVDHDGDWDLVLKFKTRETGIACGDTEAALTGETFDGQSFTGTDSIKTVGCKKPKIAKKKKHKGK